MKLTPKQEKFCNYYLESGNASEAYRRAFSCQNMAEQTVWVKASCLLAKDKVKVRIGQLRAELQKRSDITKDEAVSILADIARANIINCLDVKSANNFTTVTVKDLNSLPKSIQSSIFSIKATEKGGYELRLYNKIDAIEKLSKLLGWDEPIRQDVTTNGKDIGQQIIFSPTPLTEQDIKEIKEIQNGSQESSGDTGISEA